MRPSPSALRWSALVVLVPLLGCAPGAREGQRQAASQRQPVTASRGKAPAREQAPAARAEPRAGLPSPKDFERDMVAAHN